MHTPALQGPLVACDASAVLALALALALAFSLDTPCAKDTL